VSCPQFKGCHSYGETIDESLETIDESLETIDEALENIKEVIYMCLEEINVEIIGF